MTGTATTTGQATTQPGATSAAAASSAGDTVLGAGEAQPGTQQQATTQTQTAAGADPKAAGAAGDPAKPGEQAKTTEQGAKAPEKYADFKVPDGMTVDTAAVDAFSPAMRTLNLTQDQAQGLVDVYAQHVQTQQAAFETQLENEDFALAQAGGLLLHQRQSWAAALKTDKEIGGTNYDANVKVAARAIARFGSPTLKSLLNATGLGNNPEFVRFCLKVGQSISEDNTELGKGSGGGRKSTEDVFYGTGS